VSCRGRVTPIPTAGVFGFARPNGSAAFALLVVAATAAFPASSGVEEGRPERSCLFASGEASGFERLRLPPQIRPQPTHPVHQNIVWHPEVNGDIGVLPVLYDPAVQQLAVVVGQIPEEDAASVTTHGLHWRDLATA
jgi:hypothetical protein